jgi:hypothetical protein
VQPRIGALCAYGIAILSIAYAAIFATTGAAIAASPVANLILAGSAILATAATVAVADQLPDRPGRWVRIVGVGWALLSAAHAAQSGVAGAQGLATDPISATDPRGFATFGLTGLWLVVVGLTIRGGGTPFPGGLGLLGAAAGVDLLALYAATVAGIGPLVQVTALLGAVILGPAYWAWTGRVLQRAA